MQQERTLEAIRYELVKEFDLPEGELPKDVWERFCRLTLLKDAHRNREIMHLTLSECERLDAEATSMADKPNYVKRWLLWRTLKDALGIKDVDMNMKKELLFIQDTTKIMKAIKDNEYAYSQWGYLSKKWETFTPFPIIQKILKQRLDLNATYAIGTQNGEEKDQDRIIKYYKEAGIYQSVLGVGKDGWAFQLKSREKRWKAAKAHIDFLMGWKGVPFSKLEKPQQAYYLSYTPHLKIHNWKYGWKGKNIGREKADSFISNFRPPLAVAGIKSFERGLEQEAKLSETANDY